MNYLAIARRLPRPSPPRPQIKGQTSLTTYFRHETEEDNSDEEHSVAVTSKRVDPEKASTRDWPRFDVTNDLNMQSLF